MTLTQFRTIGRSGLVVSPLTLGTMTFGTGRWGSGDAVSGQVFDAYVDAGGNSIDTADIYSGGRSEEMVGGFMARRGLRDRLVLATKSGFGREAGNPNAGGNGAKNIRASIEISLRRLKTDYIDLYWMHAWDMVTPAEEVLQTMGDLVRAGKIRYFGLSNLPAWFVAKMATLASVHGVPGPVALQMEYSLAERAIEREHLVAAREFGIGTLPWSPLAGGFLTGKYDRAAIEANTPGPRGPELPNSSDGSAEVVSDEGRLSGANPFGDSKFTACNWSILAALRHVADAIGRTPAEVALAWVAQRPGISSVVIGASKIGQLNSNLSALDIAIGAGHLQALDEASALDPVYPYPIMSRAINRMVFGGATVN